MLAPFLRVVTVLVSQTCLPVAASRQTSSPDDLAEYTWSPRSKAVEVLLKTLRDGARFSGQSTEAAGLSASSFSMTPPSSNRWSAKTGVETTAAARVGNGS